MKDGHIVWQAQCQDCGWKDPDYGTDLDASQAHAAAHLAAEHQGRWASLVLEFDVDTMAQDEKHHAN